MKLHITKSTHRAIVWNPALVTTRPVKPPVPRFHRKAMGWEEILNARQQRIQPVTRKD